MQHESPASRASPLGRPGGSLGDGVTRSGQWQCDCYLYSSAADYYYRADPHECVDCSAITDTLLDGATVLGGIIVRYIRYDLYRLPA